MMRAPRTPSGPDRAWRDPQVLLDLLRVGRPRLGLERAGELALVERVVAPHERQHRALGPDEDQRLDGRGRVDLELGRDLRDGARARRGDLLALGVGGGRGARHPAGQLHVGRVAARVAEGHVVLPRRARSHELVRAGAAHHAGIRLHHHVGDPAAVEDAAVGVLVGVVGDLERGRVRIEGVGVLHEELPRAQHARAWARLVPLLGLDLVPDLGQVAVGADLARGQPGDDLLVGHAEAHVAPVAVLQPEHLVADHVPAPRLLPDLGGVQHRHLDLLPADAVHLLADDRVDLLDHAQAEREVHVDAGRELPDEPGPHHQLVADGFRVGGIVPERGDQRPGPAHYLTLLAPLTPGS